MARPVSEVLDWISGRVRIFVGHRPMARACVDCPFVREAAGRGYLRPERLAGIVDAKLLGGNFHCHKTVYRDGVELVENDDGELVPPIYHREFRECRGAIDAAIGACKAAGRDVGTIPEEPAR